MAQQFDIARLEKLLDCVKPERRTRVVEIGANPINSNPYGALLASGHCDVWGFEPEEKAFARLTGSDRETYLPYAIGNGEKGTLHVCRSVSLTSLLKPNGRTTRFFNRLNAPTTVEQEIEFETHRLDDIPEVPEFDLLKIDVQGGELLVYEGAMSHLEKVCAVISEVAFVPLYEDQPLLDAQMAKLRECGLDLHKFLFLKSFSLRGGLNSHLKKKGHANQLLDGDAVFLRSLRHSRNISDEQLKHMAILADTVFESFDIAIRCVDLLVARKIADPDLAEAYAMSVPDQDSKSKLKRGDRSSAALEDI